MDRAEACHIPVIVGVGQVNDRAETGSTGLDSLGLMLAAARAAGADAGGDVLSRTDWLGVVSQISFPAYSGQLVRLLSEGLGIRPLQARETPMPTGDSPLLLLHEAANAIGRGEAQVALITGGEALRTASRRAAEAATAAGEAPARRGPLPASKPALVETRHRYGLKTPTDVYPLFENAARAAYGQTLAEAQAETGRIWQAFSQVAAGNEAAWIRRPHTAEEIITPSPQNRPIAFPYSKWMVANAAVNQGAAIIVTSLAVAQAAGIPEDRLVYIGQGAAAHEDDNPLRRPHFDRSASMKVSLERTLALNNLTAGDIDHVELYSCFPCVPKMARRIIGLPDDRPLSVFGGLTFGGGPIGNYMTHAVASMVGALRRSGRHGLLFANGGFATHNHTILLTRTPQPAGLFPQMFDFQAEADRARGAVPALDEAYAGPAIIETYTVIHDRDGQPQFGVVLGRTPDGRRAIGRVPATDRAALHLLISGDQEPVGLPGFVVAEAEGNRWQMVPPGP